jgi:hypothetical protein
LVEKVSFLILTYSQNQDRYLPQPTPLLQNKAQPLLPEVFNLLFVSLLDQAVYFDFEKGFSHKFAPKFSKKPPFMNEENPLFPNQSLNLNLLPPPVHYFQVNSFLELDHQQQFLFGLNCLFEHDLLPSVNQMSDSVLTHHFYLTLVFS